MLAPDYATAFWVTNPQQGEMRREILKPPGQDEVLVRTLYSGVSRIRWYSMAAASEFARMQAPFKKRSFLGPVKYGYCSVGRVSMAPMNC